jgi:uncharacterized lipoprotein YbaY
MRLLARGVIRLDPAAPPFTGAQAFVRLEDTTYADAAASLLAEQVVEGVDHAAGAAEELPFALQGPFPPPETRSASVSAYVDVDGDGRFGPGDLVSQESYPTPLSDPPPLIVEVLLYQPDTETPQGE